MKTADVTDALLDYWTARAEGVPADELEIRPMPRPGDPRTPDSICVRRIGHLAVLRIDYSTNWAMTGPLVEKYGMFVQLYRKPNEWFAEPFRSPGEHSSDTPLIAICRAVVRSVFGDEVEDLPHGD